MHLWQAICIFHEATKFKDKHDIVIGESTWHAFQLQVVFAICSPNKESVEKRKRGLMKWRSERSDSQSCHGTTLRNHGICPSVFLYHQTWEIPNEASTFTLSEGRRVFDEIIITFWRVSSNIFRSFSERCFVSSSFCGSSRVLVGRTRQSQSYLSSNVRSFRTKRAWFLKVVNGHSKRFVAQYLLIV